MARLLSPISAWAAAFTDSDEEVIEGELVDSARPQRRIDYQTPLLMIVGAVIQIAVGCMLVAVGFTSIAGIVLVPLGVWLCLRGIRQSERSIKFLR